MGPFFFIVYVALAIFVILNMLIAIISDAYSVCREKMQKKPKVYLVAEIGEYLKQTLEDVPYLGAWLERAELEAKRKLQAAKRKGEMQAAKRKMQAAMVATSNLDDPPSSDEEGEGGGGGVVGVDPGEQGAAGDGSIAAMARVSTMAMGGTRIKVKRGNKKSDGSGGGGDVRTVTRDLVQGLAQDTDAKLADMQAQIASLNETMQLVLQAVSQGGASTPPPPVSASDC
jgi:hypothetical protein